MHIIDRINNAVLANAEKIAVYSQNEFITYLELWEESGRLADWLSHMRPGKDPIVVYGSKSVYMFVAFLACARSGHPYCPVDSSMPEERIEDILKTTGYPLVLATSDFEHDKCEVLSVEDIQRISRTENPLMSGSVMVRPEDTMYMIFTSGSTGKPKGVEISADNLSNFIEWIITYFDTDGDVINQAALSFDLSVMDIYSAFATGKTLFCIDKALQQRTSSTVEFICDSQAEFMVSTPSFVSMLLADADFRSEMNHKLATFLFCGEKLTNETVRKLFNAFPDCRIINTYGPTESTVAVSGIEITPEMVECEENLPIGYPKKGTSLYIDDEEIIIAGNTVGKGYYKDPERTNKSFFVNAEGERCYRTGDKGYEKNGCFYYIGRKDSQIKLHGYRIELGDIEQNLLKLDGVCEAAVIPKKRNGQISKLVGYVVMDEGYKLPETVRDAFESSTRLRTMLAEKLPPYMIPKKISIIEHMPLTNNGKIDRTKLGEIE